MSERNESESTDAAAPTLVQRITSLVERVMKLKPVRVLTRFTERDGDLLSAGMSFQSVFAVFAAIFVGFAIAGLWLRSSPDVLDAVVDIINGYVPGLIGGSDDDGIISRDALASASVINWAGAIALVGLLWTAIGWLGFMRQAVRAIFGAPPITRLFVLQKAIDLGLAFGFGVLLIAGGLASVVSTAALDWVVGILNLDENSVPVVAGVRAVSLVISVLVNIVALSLMFRVLSSIPIPPRFLLLGAGMGSIALAALSVVSGLILGGAGRNPLLATFAVFIGLLLWFAIVWRVVLLCAAWIAVSLDDRGVVVTHYTPEQQERREREARRIVAAAALEAARADLDGATGPIGRFRARRALQRAEDEDAAARVAEKEPIAVG
ncbi:YihY/virulence factor BrkB family protein [Labedella endophytica]|uniref:YihY/virulence factor BrkB family protein n=1 Tax=Labedella endophytica TaxID=1523160 RepID=A0A433JSS7_9MICO|nr:YihY/virulence factor BrkB family protein [Labedella endophytica]RUR01376.1 YihY/virulence factor BrkB family protein [Labedella endophytica]